MFKLYDNNSNLVWLYTMRDGVSGSAVTTATGTGWLIDSTGTKVVGSDFTMTHSASGSYYGAIPHQAVIENGKAYTIIIEMLDGTNRASFRIPATAVARES